MGRPPKYENDPVTKPISLRIGLRQAAALNSIAAARNCTRLDVLRQAVDDVLEDEQGRPIFRADQDVMALYQGLTPYQIRAINSLSAADPRLRRLR